MIETREPTQPLLEGHGIVFVGQERAEARQLSIRRGPIYLHGVQGMVDAWVDPSLLKSGEFVLLGMPVKQALRSGRVGLAPSVLPGPAKMHLGRALSMSAHLAGQKSSNVARCLELTDLLHSKSTPLGQLTQEEQRRAGVAHALLTDPEVLVFCRPFFGLSDRARREVTRLIERVTQDTVWILAGEPSCPTSRTWADRAAWIVSEKEEDWSVDRPPLSGLHYFVELTRLPEGLIEELKVRGATVTRSMNPHVLLVEGLDEASLSELCGSFSGCRLIGIEPAEEGGFVGSHAKSAL